MSDKDTGNKMTVPPTDLMMVSKVNGKLSRAVKVTLCMTDKDVYKRSGEAFFTIKGFRRLNKYARISIVKPPQMLHEGKKVENPYFIKDASGNTVAAKIRGTGIGYTVGGGLVMLDQSLYYDVKSILVGAIMSKMKDRQDIAFLSDTKLDKVPESYIGRKRRNSSDKWNDAGADVAAKGEDGEMTEYSTTSGRWHYIEIDPLIGGIYYNVAHWDMESIIRMHIERIQSLSSRINTILERQILKTHPAIGYGSPEEFDARERLWKTTITTWRSSLTQEELIKLSKMVEDGDTFVADTNDIRVITSSLSLTTEDTMEQEDEDVTEEETHSDDEKAMKQELINWIKDPARIDRGFAFITKPLYECSVDELKEITENMTKREE